MTTSKILNPNHQGTEVKIESESSGENNERWKLALESEGVGVWDYDFQTNQVFYSKRYKEMYALTEDDATYLTHHNWSDCVHPDDKKQVMQTVKEYLAGERAEFSLEYRMLCSDGSYKWILDRAMMVERTQEGKPVRMIGTHKDISARKQMEIEREQYFKLFNLSLDMQSIATLDGYFKQVNPAFTNILGYSREELLAKPLTEFIHPKDRQATLDEMARQKSCGVTLGFENRYIKKDGSICWLSWNAFLNPEDQLIYGVARDVTETKKIEENLQLAEMVYENSIQGIMITDANNQIISVNPAFTEITGYTLQEVIGKNPRIFKSGIHPPEFYQQMWHDINTNGYWQGEVWDKRKDGELHAKFLTINAVLNKEQKVYRYLALFSDITSRKQYEEEIKRLSESELNKAKLEAERANKAKSDFLASMSHELFTPMNAVLGFAQVLECEDLTEEQCSYVDCILEGSYHLLDLIKEVLDFSVIESQQLDFDFKNVELANLINCCTKLMQTLAEKKHITINSNALECSVTVMSDALRLKQVLLNLLSNAIKYNRENGSITLSCELTPEKKIRVKVIDTGVGIDKEQMDRLFYPFERLSFKDSAVEGAGLGLCISKKLVEAMCGEIGVESSLGKGSCFWIDLPIVYL